MVRILGGPLRLNERAAHNIFSGWIHRAAMSRPLLLKKLHNFFELKEPLGGNKSELDHVASAWHIFPMLHFRANFFSTMRALRQGQARLAGAL